jgi:hypothetical protein
MQHIKLDLIEYRVKSEHLAAMEPPVSDVCRIVHMYDLSLWMSDAKISLLIRMRGVSGLRWLLHRI